MSRSRTRLVDARWAGPGGIGRVTRQLVAGLAEMGPDGEWAVWSDDAALAWPGARHVPGSPAPWRWAGQRSLLSVPECEIALFPANLRPLRPVGRASLTVIHDTIPLRHARTWAHRPAYRAVFTAAAHLSTVVLTDSEFSARAIERDLRISPDRIRVIPVPLDRALTDEVRRRRVGDTSLSPSPLILYVGRFAPHKNLPRLVAAFSRSSAARHGARLVVAGGRPAEVDELRLIIPSRLSLQVEVRGQLTEHELTDLYATAAVVAVPSLEEGYGLPVVEATAAGIPVMASTAGAIAEVVGGRLPLVDPTDVDAMAAGLDAAVSAHGRIPDGLRAWTDSLPTGLDLARLVLEEVDRLG